MGVQVILEGRARTSFWASTFSAQWEAKSIPKGDGRGINIEGLKREENVWMSLWEEERRALPGKHDLPMQMWAPNSGSRPEISRGPISKIV